MVSGLSPRVVCSAFIEKDRKFLLVFSPTLKVWRVPGGKVEFGESLEETVIREMQEEIGITLKNPKFLGYDQDTQYHYPTKSSRPRLLLFFHAKIKQEPKIAPIEAEEYKWVSLEELKKHKNKERALEDFLNRNPTLKL